MSRKRPRRDPPPKKSLYRRLARAAAWAAAGWVALSILLVLPLRWLDPPTSSFMLQARLEGYPVHYRWADWRDISPSMPVAAIAAEDQRFRSHAGFDLHSIRSALLEEQGRMRGASTISQQVAKNLWLWPGRSWFRKGLEAWFTLCIEALWPKRRILEIYLNVAEFGPGIFGVESAARRYFGKAAAALGDQEAALLAAVLPDPKDLSPVRPSDYVRRRAGWIRRQAQQLGGPAYLADL